MAVYTTPPRWRAFALLGVLSLIVAVIDIVPVAADRSLLAYGPLALLQLTVMLLLLAPLLILNRRFYSAVVRPNPAHMPAARLWAYRLLAHWLVAFAATLGVVPGLFLIQSANAVPLFAIILALTFIVLRVLAGTQRAALAIWIAASFYAIFPTLLNAGFFLIF